jgi:hypothetical protein
MSYFGLDPVLGYNPEVVNISNSEMSTFKEDRRKWFLGYYLGLEARNKPVDGPLPLGTRVHYALEMYYTNHDNPVDVYVKNTEEDHVWLLADGRDDTKFLKEAELGRIMLEGYLEWVEETGADSVYDVVSAEEKLAVPIMDGRVNLIGKLDMRVKRKTDGVRLFMDHKTCASFDSVSKIAHLNWQPKMYMLLEMLKEDEEQRCDGMIYNMLRKVKRSATATPPFYQRVEVRHNRETMNAFWYQVHGVASDILHVREALDRGADHNLVCYPNPTGDSTWKDPFFALGGLMDDGSAADRFIEDFYIQRDPYQRYETEIKEVS